jgi:hypothetical protein
VFKLIHSPLDAVLSEIVCHDIEDLMALNSQVSLTLGQKADYCCFKLRIVDKLAEERDVVVIQMLRQRIYEELEPIYVVVVPIDHLLDVFLQSDPRRGLEVAFSNFLRAISVVKKESVAENFEKWVSTILPGHIVISVQVVVIVLESSMLSHPLLPLLKLDPPLSKPHIEYQTGQSSE